MRKWRFSLAALAIAAATVSARAPDPEPSLALVLQRAADYVTTFHARLSRIVAEERYTQASEMIWSGKRSGNVIQYLESNFGFTNLYNLEGGILAWADEIDDSMPKY